MQTFLPYEEFERSAQVLDRLRLGKQRVEVIQLLRACLENSGWKNHPATKMWKNYESGLVEYGLIICQEWQKRGYKDSCLKKIMDIQYQYNLYSTARPKWLGNKDFHISHQSNLLRKDEEYYRKFFPDTPNNLPYVWPEPI
jgi:hypothetical protein